VPLRSGSRVLALDGIMPGTVWPPVCRVCSATERYRCPLRGITESRAATVPPPVRIEHAVAYSLATASQSSSCSSRDRGHDRALAGLGRWSGLGKFLPVTPVVRYASLPTRTAPTVTAAA
jgi:hypothetical protein